MAIKLLPGEDRTGQVWYPYGLDPTEEAFLIVGPPKVTVKRFYDIVLRRELEHPIVHLRSGRPSVRTERSRPVWFRNYVDLASDSVRFSSKTGTIGSSLDKDGT